MFANTLIGVLASAEGGGSLLDVNPGLIVWTLVTFILLLVLLKKVAWKPILTALDKREKGIEESLNRAEKAKEEAQKILDENKASLSKAEEEAKKIIDQSRSYADELKGQMLKQSKEQAQKLIDDAVADIERKKQSAFEELRNQIAEISVNAAEKIMRETIDAERNKQLVTKYLKEISSN